MSLPLHFCVCVYRERESEWKIFLYISIEFNCLNKVFTFDNHICFTIKWKEAKVHELDDKAKEK